MERKSTIQIIIIVVLFIIATFEGAYIFCKTKFNKGNENNINISDRYAFALDNYGQNRKLRLQIYFVDNGYLYYQIKELDNKSDEDLIEYTQDLPSSLKTKKLNKFTKLSNIKRIKGANTISNGVDFDIIAITEDGKVYEIINNNGSLSTNEIEDFKDYKVDDIINYEPIEGCINGQKCESKYTIKTIDGKEIKR